MERLDITGYKRNFIEILDLITTGQKTESSRWQVAGKKIHSLVGDILTPK